MTSSLKIVLLGQPLVTLDEVPVTQFVSNKARALFYYLAAEPRLHDRAELAVFLWGGDRNAKRNLRDIIYNLRQTFEPFLTITRTQIGLRGDVDIYCDLYLWERLLAQRSKSLGEWQQLLELYRGEFLAGFGLDHVNEFEEWLAVFREQMEIRFTHILETAVQFFSAQQDLENTVRFAHQLLLRESWSETGHQQLMLAYALQGLRNKALTQYKNYCTALNLEIGAEPSRTMRDYYQQILDGKVDFMSAETQPHNLPTPLTPLIGRRDILTRAVVQIEDQNGRLLTIGGPGGAGKTRLALDLGWYFVNHNVFTDGVFWVNLVDVMPSGRQLPHNAVIHAIIEALGLPISNIDLETQLYDIVRDKHLLLILDNFEHLQSASMWIAQLLMRTSKLSLVITSRRWLNLSNEYRLPLAGLNYVDHNSLEEESAPAVQLFTQQAQALNLTGDFEQEENDAIRQICELVDGLPLGIVLAARWARLLSPRQIASQMATSLNFLQDAAVDTPARHNSLQAVFNYSWSLLEEDARIALSRLSYFRGGFDIPAAEAVGISLGTLFLLLDCSLVVDASVGHIKRFDVPVSIREFALARLSIREEYETHQRHVTFYLSLLERYLPKLRHFNEADVLDVIGRDLENIDLAWNFAWHQNNLTAASIEAFFLYFDMKSLFRDGYNMFHTADIALLEADLRAMVLTRSGWFAFHLGQVGYAKLRLNQALTLTQAAGHTAEVALALSYLAAIHFHENQLERAQDLAEQAQAQGGRLNSPYHLTIVHNILGDIGFRQKRYNEATAHSEKSLALTQTVEGNLWSKTFSLTNLGRIAKAQFEYDKAASYFRQSLSIREAMGDLRGMALCYLYLGETAMSNSQSLEARRYLYMAQSLLQQIGSMREASTPLIHLGHLAFQEGEYKDAVHYFNRALVLARGFNQKTRIHQSLLGLTHIWRESNPVLVTDIELFLSDNKIAGIGQLALHETNIDYVAPAAPDIQPLDVLISRILAYADMS